MAEPSIRFHFDFLSPYAYLAWTQIHAIAARTGREVEAVPVLFAGLLNAHGTKGPAEVPAKRVYVFKDTMRTAMVLGVPLAPPPSHPFNPLVALRACSVPMTNEERTRLVTGLFEEVWGGGRGVTDPNTIADVATRVGLDGPAILKAAGEEPAKTALREATELAIRDGVFGIPTMIVGWELFWGLDSLPHLERYLRGEDPLQKVDLFQWGDVPASATRRVRSTS